MDIKYPITVDEFKGYFYRDFPFLPTDEEVENPLDYVQDKDIEKAMLEAYTNFNAGLWEEEVILKMAFSYLTAHYLVTDLSNAAQGVNGSFSGFMSSKSVGNVSVGYRLPQWILNDPMYSLIALTTYGRKYLQLILPRMVGQMFSVKGTTRP